MAYGQKMGSIKALKDSLKKGSAGFIKYVPKNGSLTVRFLEEPENWVNYIEHYDSTLRKSYPCNGEAACPGCVSDERKSSRYLANAVDTSNDRVIPLQMPKELANRLVVRYEKNGTITDRDYELSRTGEGLDTVYDLDAEPPTNRKLTKYKPLDLLKTLDDSFQAVFGEGDEDDDDDDTAAPAKKTAGVKPRKKTAAARKATAADPEDDDDADDDEDIEDVPEGLRSKAEKAAVAKKAAAKPAFQADDEDDDDDDTDDDDADDDAEEDADDSDSDDEDESDDDDEDADDEDASGEDADGDDDDYFTEAELNEMSLGQLRALAKDYDPPIPTKGLSKPQIVDAIMNYDPEAA